ncbi:MAG: hypothetical protein ACI4GB_03310 [Acutalibacteraceae bacterium]
MNKIISYIAIIFAILLAYISYGNPEGFQPVVIDPVTTETQVVVVTGENNTGNFIGDPKVMAVEKIIDGQWVEISGRPEDNAIATKYPPLGTYTEEIPLWLYNIEGVGEYRAKIHFSLYLPIYAKNDVEHYTTYAYFNVEEAE